MRRLLTASVLVSMLVSCSTPTAPPRTTLALEQLLPGVGLDIASARRTVLEFLDAYANAAADDGQQLSQLVATTKLTSWVHWLSVQNRSFPGTIEGSVELRSLRFARAVPAQGSLAAQMKLGATVTIDYVPEEGEPQSLPRVLDGDVTLFLRGPGDWGIVDLTRDGGSMAQSIHLFNELSASLGGLVVRLDSLFTFPPFWAFNVVVTNRTEHQVVFDPMRAQIRSGSEVQERGRAATEAIRRIPAGSEVEGSVNFLTPEDASEDRVLRLEFRVGKHTLRFRFPLPAIVSPTPAPSPTTPAPSPSPTP